MKDRWPNLQDLIDGNGAINIGQIEPISGVAIAMQSRQVHAMLRIGEGESLAEVLDRLDFAVGKAIGDGVPVDEINR